MNSYLNISLYATSKLFLFNSVCVASIQHHPSGYHNYPACWLQSSLSALAKIESGLFNRAANYETMTLTLPSQFKLNPVKVKCKSKWR